MKTEYFYKITEQDVLENIVNLKQLTFELTDACNLKCKYCGYGEFYGGYDERKSKFLTWDQAKTIIDYLIDIWNTHKAKSRRPCVYFSFYGGEPLLNMELIKQIISYTEDRAADIDREIVFTMTTNAILLDKYMDYLVEKNVRPLISLDGNKQAQSYRVDHAGKNSFGKVFRNVKLLQKTYPEYFNSHVNFNSVLHNRNSVLGIYEFTKKVFGKKGSISELNNAGIRPDKTVEFNKTYQNKYESLHQAENYKELSDVLFVGDPDTHDLLLFLNRYSGNTFKNYHEFFTDPDKAPSFPTGTCSPFSKKMFVTVNGKIIQCERIDHQFSLGYIANHQVHMNLQQIADMFNEYVSRLYSQCISCNIRKSCTQCIYYLDGLNPGNPICKGYMNSEKFEQYKLSNLHYLSQHPHLYRKLMEEVIIS